jgi:phosphatidylinositol-3-phosphatase
MKVKCLIQTAVVSAFLASGLSTAQASTSGLMATTGPIFVIVMENQNWSRIKGSSHAPYINSLLKHPQASYAANYNNPPSNHPSEPNYLWIEGGTNFGITDDNDPTNTHNQIKGKDHFVKQLTTKGIDWKTYQEDITGTVCPLSSKGKYAAKHNPFVFFDDVTTNFTKTSSNCIAHVRPFVELKNDLSRNTVARYVFITPNLCNDMHNPCSPVNNRIKQGDNWLKTVVPMIMGSTAYQNNGALIITWDEAASGDGPIGFILLSPNAKGNGYSNSTYYTHGSLLRTLEENMGVPYLNDANSQSDLADLFK